jgi:hypothetical protein
MSLPMWLLPSTTCKLDPFCLVGTSLPSRFLIRDHHGPAEMQMDTTGGESRLLPAMVSRSMQGPPDKRAERLCVLRTEAIAQRGNLRQRLASRFHLPPHIGSAQTRGGVKALLRWEAPSLLPTGKVREPGRGWCSLSVSWLRSCFSPWELPRPGRGLCPPRSQRACERARTRPGPCGST